MRGRAAFPRPRLCAAWAVAAWLLASCGPSSADQIEGHVKQARQHLEQARPQQALAAFERALEIEEQVPTLLAIAQIHASLGRWDQAERYLERARIRAPLSGDVQLGLIDVAIARGQHDTARNLAQAQAQRMPMEPTPRLLVGAFADTAERADAAQRELAAWRSRVKGDLRMRELLVVEAVLERQGGDIKASRAMLERARSMPPGDASRCVRLARIYLARGEWQAAQALLDAAARKALVTRSLWLLLAGAALEASDYTEAKKALDNADRIGTRDGRRPAEGAELSILRARVALGMGQAKAAHDVLQRALARLNDPQLDAEAARLHYWLGRSLGRLGHAGEARAEYASIGEDAATYSVAQLGLAELELAAGEETAGRTRLEALAARGGPMRAYSLLAEQRTRDGDAAGAEKALRAGLAQHARSATLWLELARLLTATGRTPAARAVADQALAVAPFNIATLGMAASLAEQSGDFTRAMKLYERALDVEPEFVPAMNNLAFLHAEHEIELEEGLRLAETAHAAMPDNPLIADTLAWVMHRQGDHARAHSLLEEALRVAPEHPQLLYHLGAVLLARGEVAKGQQTLRHALARSSDFVGASDARALLASGR